MSMGIPPAVRRSVVKRPTRRPSRLSGTGPKADPRQTVAWGVAHVCRNRPIRWHVHRQDLHRREPQPPGCLVLQRQTHRSTRSSGTGHAAVHHQTVARGLVYICGNRDFQRAARRQRRHRPDHQPPATRPPSDKPTAPPAPPTTDAPPDAGSTAARLLHGRPLQGVWCTFAETATSDRH